MPETTETHVITDIPAEKQKRHNPFAKKSETETTSDTNETPKRKHRGPHGVYAAGLLLLVGGVVGAAASKLGRSTDAEVAEDSSDTTDVA